MVCHGLSSTQLLGAVSAGSVWVACVCASRVSGWWGVAVFCVGSACIDACMSVELAACGCAG
eukprot:5372567-Prorocentrum_lima.AAC.1